jgi:16S rRNA (uracil1498-N3)-methyltransferase
VKRFILNALPDHEGLVRLTGKDYHYLVRVRRLGAGAVFRALLPAGPAFPEGQEVRVRIRSVEGNVLTGECLAADTPCPDDCGSVRPISSSGMPPILLFQALPKGTKMDLIVRQAAEGGVAEVVPFISAHSVPRSKFKATDSGSVVSDRGERWARIVKEARQQSGSAEATVVRELCTLEELLLYWEKLRAGRPNSLGLLFHQDPLEQGPLHGYLNSNPELVALAVGPEGGFSPEEVRRFVGAGFKPMVMGNTVLRTETAALYGAAAVRIILLERASWLMKTPLQ